MRKYLLLLVLPVIFVLSFLASPAFSASQPLKLETKGFLVVNEIKGGKKRELLKPLPEKVYPRDIIEYQITVKNISKNGLKNVEIKAQIPKSTVYVEHSANGNPLFSIDGGKSFSPEPVKYRVVENGKEKEKIATPDMYTNIMWKIPQLLPGTSEVLKYRVKVK